MAGISIIASQRITPRQLGFILSGTADAIADWYLDQWDAGEDPPCCAKCAGAKYRPDKTQQQVVVDMADELLRKLRGSCQSIAVMHTGHKRAERVNHLLAQGRTETDAWADARSAFKIGLEQQGVDSQGNPYFHAYSIDEGQKHDATEGMKT